MHLIKQPRRLNSDRLTVPSAFLPAASPLPQAALERGGLTYLVMQPPPSADLGERP